MKKNSFIILGFFLVAESTAQKDSLKKFRFSGIQVDIGLPIYPNYKQQNQADYQKVVKEDAFLNTDLSSYKKQEWYVYNSTLSGLVGLKCYVTINEKRKLRKEIFFGLKFGEEGANGIYYNKQSYDTIAVYPHRENNKNVYEISVAENDYTYAHTSKKLTVPLGINISTNKNQFVWITTGIQLEPVLNFNYVFTSTHGLAHTTIYVYEGNSNYASGYFGQGQNITQIKTKLKGAGYGLYASLPFTMYLRLFKRIVFLKHLNLLASISPLYVYSYNKYFGSASGVTMSMATGIRYNW